MGDHFGEEKINLYQRCCPGYGSIFLFMFSTMFVNPLINGYAKELGASSAFAGIIVGIMSLAAMFLRPVAGNLTDKFSKYRLSFIGGTLIL